MLRMFLNTRICKNIVCSFCKSIHKKHISKSFLKLLKFFWSFLKLFFSFKLIIHFRPLMVQKIYIYACKKNTIFLCIEGSNTPPPFEDMSFSIFLMFYHNRLHWVEASLSELVQPRRDNARGDGIQIEDYHNDDQVKTLLIF